MEPITVTPRGLHGSTSSLGKKRKFFFDLPFKTVLEIESPDETIIRTRDQEEDAE